MNTNKSSISQAASYLEIGAFWDNHDLGDYWEQTQPAAFEVDLQSEIRWYALDQNLSQQVAVLAKQRGLSSAALLNLWVQEKVREQSSALAA